MKKLLSLLPILLVLLPVPVLAQKKAGKVQAKPVTPTLEVYEVRKYEEGKVRWPQVILEISNPTNRTFYITGGEMSGPLYDIEAKRDGKWGRVVQVIECGLGLGKFYPVRPGVKMLVSATMARGEEASRYRIFFYRDAKGGGDVVSARTREIEMKELGEERKGESGSYQKNGEFIETKTDEEINLAAAEERRRNEEEARKAEGAKKAETPDGK